MEEDNPWAFLNLIWILPVLLFWTIAAIIVIAALAACVFLIILVIGFMLGVG